MSRTRLIRPEFFTDELMAASPIPTRFIYIGLWTLCDDAGYFENKPRQIAASLLPYDGPTHRQKIVDKALADLVAMGRVRVLDCGIHGWVPTLTKHGQKGGNKSETYLARHRSTCLVRTAPQPVRTGTDKSSSVSVSVSVSDSVETGASATKDGPTFEAMLPRALVLGGRKPA